MKKNLKRTKITLLVLSLRAAGHTRCFYDISIIIITREKQCKARVDAVIETVKSLLHASTNWSIDFCAAVVGGQRQRVDYLAPRGCSSHSYYNPRLVCRTLTRRQLVSAGDQLEHILYDIMRNNGALFDLLVCRTKDEQLAT